MTSKTSSKLVPILIFVILSLSVPGHSETLNKPVPLNIKSKAACVSLKGTDFELAPGKYLPVSDWDSLDVRFKLLQNRVVRLEAENKSLKDSDPPSNWKTTLILVSGAMAVGIFSGKLL